MTVSVMDKSIIMNNRNDSVKMFVMSKFVVGIIPPGKQRVDIVAIEHVGKEDININRNAKSFSLIRLTREAFAF